MNPDAPTLYVPREWVEKKYPAPQINPNDFLHRVDGQWTLQPTEHAADPENFTQHVIGLTPGDAIAFDQVRLYGKFTFTLTDDLSIKVDREIPDDANLFWLAGDGDTCSDTLAELATWEELEPGHHEAECNFWSGPLYFRFRVASDGRGYFKLDHTSTFVEARIALDPDAPAISTRELYQAYRDFMCTAPENFVGPAAFAREMSAKFESDRSTGTTMYRGLKLKPVAPTKKQMAKALSVSIKEGQLHISIGIATLAWTVQMQDAWPEDFYVSDLSKFAKSMAQQLKREEEDGTTAVHRMLDAAADAVMENGDDGVDEGDVETGLDLVRPYMQGGAK
ncbi:hypothetical protein IFT84_20405 [Rhizobium sp. CFBP 8762]|uniref:hypothetical protein n=1 Tax=Rhizobium sp. CFBP 8762 TaxID=2775279 RepID=UPI001786CF4F|nr:hypothetical protein [Rhizobium sp. CFBP 8762]MBD8556875.1 hypothetical protein [Rhizobium sp. CFBP 8762]